MKYRDNFDPIAVRISPSGEAYFNESDMIASFQNFMLDAEEEIDSVLTAVIQGFVRQITALGRPDIDWEKENADNATGTLNLGKYGMLKWFCDKENGVFFSGSDLRALVRNINDLQDDEEAKRAFEWMEMVFVKWCESVENGEGVVDEN